MSGPIKYTDNQGGTVFVKDNGDYGCIDMATDDPEQGHVHVRGPMRQKIAQALAGGGYEVNERLADWERELLDKQTRIDPAEVKVGDVVEVTHTGTVKEISFNAHLLLVTREDGHELYHHARNATVRLVRRAEPEPDPEQVEALASALADFHEWHRQNPIVLSDRETAEWLAKRGVTVREDT